MNPGSHGKQYSGCGERERANRRVKEDTRTMVRESRRWKMGRGDKVFLLMPAMPGLLGFQEPN